MLGGAEVVERRDQPAGVVPTLHVPEDTASESGPCRPSPGVGELALHGGEERFRRRGAPGPHPAALESGLAHEAGHPRMSAGHRSGPQLLVDTRLAIDAVEFGMDGGDVLRQLGIGMLALIGLIETLAATGMVWSAVRLRPAIRAYRSRTSGGCR